MTLAADSTIVDTNITNGLATLGTAIGIRAHLSKILTQ